MNEQMKLIKQKENILNIKEILEILLKNKETIEFRYRKGEILQYACEIQNSEFVKFILLSNDIDINAKSIFNNISIPFKIKYFDNIQNNFIKQHYISQLRIKALIL